MLNRQDDIRAVLAERFGDLTDSRRAGDHRMDVRRRQRIGSLPSGRDRFERDLPERAATRLGENEYVSHQSTFASSRSSRTSSGTAAAPSPTIRPAGRSGGSASDSSVSETGPS